MIQGVVQSLWESDRPISEEDAFDLMNCAISEGETELYEKLRYDVYPNILQAVIVVDQIGPRIQGLLYPCMHPFHFRGSDKNYLAKLAAMPFPVSCNYCKRIMNELAG